MHDRMSVDEIAGLLTEIAHDETSGADRFRALKLIAAAQTTGVIIPEETSDESLLVILVRLMRGLPRELVDVAWAEAFPREDPPDQVFRRTMDEALRGISPGNTVPQERGWLRARRVSAGLTLRPWARRLGVPETWLSNVEGGHKPCPAWAAFVYSRLSASGDGSLRDGSVATDASAATCGTQSTSEPTGTADDTAAAASPAGAASPASDDVSVSADDEARLYEFASRPKKAPSDV